MPPDSNFRQWTLDAWISRRSPSRPVASTSGQASRAEQRPPRQLPSSHYSPYATDRRTDPYRRGTALAAVAQETLAVLPNILAQLPHIDATRSERHYYTSLAPLDAIYCPRRSPARIRVVNDDTFNAALNLAAAKGPGSGRVAVLNMASHISPGGGWLKGARAQEEALCYRSSLALSLHRRYFPWKQRMGLYTRDVVVIRSDQDSGHHLLTPHTPPANLPIVSVLSIAALKLPPLADIVKTVRGHPVTRTVFAKASDRELTKLKMRLCLRMAAHRRHRLLVLGALGCGAFQNPPREIARCWLEVLKEPEFQGGWWEEIWFAVFDKRGEGNLEIFEEILDGVSV
ncbi:hypothetical protein LB507_009633 [Fusarium sp. FIESC RH6]|nr:hypothetical protein LB507_009633 [Fusarium sp. FIESC RH6]